jgi:hypothetical protein
LNTAEEHTEMMLKMKYADDNIIIQ